MTILLQIEGPKETFPVLKTSDVISMYRLVIVLSGEVICSKLFIVIRYIFSGGFQGPQRYRRALDKNIPLRIQKRPPFLPNRIKMTQFQWERP